MTNDQKMFAKGYRFKLIPINNAMRCLYAKTALNISELMKDFPSIAFDVSMLLPDDTIKPIKETLADLYLQFVNDFITTQGFANYHGISKEQSESLIQLGKQFHEQRVESFKLETSHAS